MVDGTETSFVTIAGTSLAAAAALLSAVWHASRKVSAGMPKFSEDRAHSDFIVRMREEVARLEVIIDKMQTRIEDLERRTSKSDAHVGRLRTEAVGVYALLVGMRCSCHTDDEWEMVHGGLKRIISASDII
jgi:hypothetical protein